MKKTYPLLYCESGKRYRCRVVARMRNSVLVEFRDGRQMLVSRNALRLA
jgi:hypothetical protein